MKAPGPDGLHGVFYKRFWLMLGEELTDEVLEAVNTKRIPEGWNDTMTMLIPKVENPKRISLYRPISLCYVVYKVISKMLANHSKVLLLEIIGHHQRAFVPGRLITDILLAYESIHTVKKKRG